MLVYSKLINKTGSLFWDLVNKLNIGRQSAFWKWAVPSMFWNEMTETLPFTRKVSQCFKTQFDQLSGILVTRHGLNPSHPAPLALSR